jgi:flagellar M-ring protein FliF
VNLQGVREQIRALIAGLTIRQRISIALAVTLVSAAIGLLLWNRDSDRYRPLFTHLSAEDAAGVVSKLKEKNVDYRLAENGASVLVPQDRLAEARLEIAASGLPKTGRIGFELFDKTNLGATDFAEQVNFRRALEGELERTVRTISEVEEARVHLTFPKDSVFLEHRLPAKASVLLRIRPQAEITSRNVQAVQHLVAAAVDGLAPEAVSVLDVNGNLLSRPAKAKDSGEVSDEFMEYRKKIEGDLLAKVSTTLDPLLGAGKYRTAILVDLEASSGEQSEETFNPDLSVMTTSQKSEETVSGSGGGGIPGTASTLPRPAARTSGGGTAVSKRTENISYQTSKTVRRLKLPQGNVRRISASVLLDQTVRWDREGSGYRKVLVPPAPETVRAIRELIAATIGIQVDRGDQLVIESLPFESTLLASPPPVPGQPPAQGGRPGTKTPEAQPWMIWLQNPLVIGGAAAGILIFAGAAIWFLRRKPKRRKASVSVQPAIGQERGATAELGAGAELPRLDGGQTVRSVHTARIEQLTKALRENIAEDPMLAAGVLRTWLEAAAERHQ